MSCEKRFDMVLSWVGFGHIEIGNKGIKAYTKARMMNNTTEIAVQYHLPTNWEQEKAIYFDHLSEVVTLLHDSAYSATVKAVNRFATVRNYVIGYYIVEYEQHGSDRAKYGDRLLKRLAEKVNKRGINETLLQICRKFYTAYPQIYAYLTGEISATPSHKLISATPSQNSP